MNFEEKFFRRYEIIYEKLQNFGFILKNNAYFFEKLILNGSFRVIIQIDKQANLQGKIFEVDLDEEYDNFRNENQNGEFVNKVREEYLKVLAAIRDNCCIKKDFIYPQTNLVSNQICEKFNTKPEFLWKDSNAGVFRNKANRKWFAIIMDIDKSKIDKSQKGLVEVINLKLDNVEKYWDFKSIYPAYHMNKKYWLTIVLDNSLSNERIMELVKQSFDNISG